MKSPRQKEDKKKESIGHIQRRRSIIALLSVICLIAVSLIVAGCQSAPTPVPVTQQSQSAPTGSNNPTPTATDNTTKKVDIAIDNANKSSTQVQQQVIANAVADGSYSDDVSYFSPGGKNTVEIDVTVKDDVVTALNIIPVGSVDGRSSRYISGANNGLQSLVIGQKIDQLNIPHQVGGSSLTTAAFKQEIANLIAKY